MMSCWLRVAVVLYLCVGAATAFKMIEERMDQHALLDVGRNYDQTIVEIAIVCDRDFGIRLNFDRQRILNYWQHLFWDVNLRYQTLQNVNISFRVTSILILEVPEEQSFVETVRAINGAVHLEDVLSSFESWLPSRNWLVRNYDIAIAAIGAQYQGESIGVARRQAACSHHFFIDKSPSSLVVATRSIHPAFTVAHEIAHLLGAPHDGDEGSEYSKQGCDGLEPLDNNYIMRANGSLTPDLFSACTAKFISVFVNSFLARCLNVLSTRVQPLIDSAQLSRSSTPPFPGLSIKEQCQILMNDSGAYLATKEDKSCSITICRRMGSIFDEEFITSDYLSPFYGSPCGRNKRCFRGHCMSEGVRLISVVNSDCVRSKNSTSSSDFAGIGDCSKITSNSETYFHVLSFKPSGFLLSMLHSDRKGTITGRKCMAISNYEGQDVLKFEECTASWNSSLKWEVSKLSNGNQIENGAFMLMHTDTGKCLKYQSNKQHLTMAECVDGDDEMMWQCRWENGTFLNYDSLDDFLETPSWLDRQFYRLGYFHETVVSPVGRVGIALFIMEKIAQFIAFIYRFLLKRWSRDLIIKID